jgi:hypothetical protein
MYAKKGEFVTERKMIGMKAILFFLSFSRSLSYVVSVYIYENLKAPFL